MAHLGKMARNGHMMSNNQNSICVINSNIVQYVVIAEMDE